MKFEEIYQTYADAVYGYLMFKLKDQHLVDDILQETFMAVYQGIGKVHEIASLKAWVLSIAHNKMVDYLRKGHAKEETLNTELVAAEPDNFVNNLFLHEALNHLQETDRSIIYGLYVEGLNCQELAFILQIPEGTVKSKAYYARKRLHHWLQEGSK